MKPALLLVSAIALSLLADRALRTRDALLARLQQRLDEAAP